MPLASNVVDIYISHLRTNLRDAGAYGLLRTVRGDGYALRGPGPERRLTRLMKREAYNRASNSSGAMSGSASKAGRAK
ncbi:winged helix-turn-helix domain-containing protein [Deinococcus ruber]|uniref:winged helix-turn-helix domain-containing protein n=1 Tax=Deinococcus ruber TaxID=1848197 RepID=UPI0027E417EB|nr:winged helix-turn-helix domain-containing protein [Deinococcus ruber]